MSYQVIARKYRPQTFDDVVGQKVITDTLKNAIQSNRVAHGYIFSGARGVGKTTTARILAKALNCEKGPAVVPCGECASCIEIAAGNSVDVFEIDAASNRGIDEIRELRENVRYLPARDRYKVFIIDEAHMLTTEAFNALLKTLEEPPPRTLFILATTEAHKLPATIQSRCQHFAFRLLEYNEIYSRLEWVLKQEGVKADEGSLAALTQASEGSMRDALSLADQVIASCGNQLKAERVRQVLGVVPSELFAELAEAISAQDSERVLEMVNRLSAEGYELTHFCGEFTRFVRNLAVARSCGADSPLLQVPPSERATLGRLAKLFGEEDLARFFQVLLRTESEMRYALRPRYHLELGLLKLVHAKKLVSLENILARLQGGGEGPAAGTSGVSTARRPVGSSKGVEAAPISEARAAVAGPATTSAPAHSPETRSAALPASSPEPHPSEDPRVTEIKARAFAQSKLLSSCLDGVSRWRFENGEVRLMFSKTNGWAMDFLSSREQQEKLRAVCSQVLGHAVKIYAKLDPQESPERADRPAARDRAEADAAVEAFRKKFGCTVVDVIDLSRG
jgi:DNA polymerase III subunit gamma/tau